MREARIAFSPRKDVLDPVAAVGVGSVAQALAARLLEMAEDRLKLLRGVAGRDMLIVLGEGDALPWVDGIVYLGRDPSAPSLLVPTALRPDVAMDVFERAIARRASSLASPWAVLHEPKRVVSVADARRVERAHLEAWIAERA
jgi:hypothetical protein